MAHVGRTAALALLAHYAMVTLAVDPLGGQDLHWSQSGAVAKDKIIKLSFWVKLTHTHDLKDILNRVSDPKSSEYGHYLSKAQVDALTKPTAEHISVVENALKGYKYDSQNAGAVISAGVPVSFAEKLLGGKFVYFCHASTDGSAEDICAVRNPTAKVPSELRDACDIISPIDDPLPPVRPLPGPIIEPTENSRASSRPTLLTSMAMVAESKPTAGCCFSIGYGDLMKPCCLTTKAVSDVTTCRSKRLMGGASGYSVGECPATADEAAARLQGRSDHVDMAAHSLESVKAPTPPQEIQTDAEPSGPGCCFSLGYGGPMMRPCCLLTNKTTDVGTCDGAKDGAITLGGASSFTRKACPTTAEQAETIIEMKALKKQKPPGSLQMIQHPTAAGCCFSLGYGAMMKPCCLDAKKVSDVSTCAAQQRLGGASSFSTGNCPVDAEEAAQIVAEQRKQARTQVHQVATKSSTVETASKPAKHSAADGDYTTTTLLVICLAGCAAIVSGVLVAARRRQDGRSTPFLGNDGAE